MIKVIETNEWTDLGIDSGTKVMISTTNGVGYRLTTEDNPSSDDDCSKIPANSILAMKAPDTLKAKPDFASDLPLNISIQAI